MTAMICSFTQLAHLQNSLTAELAICNLLPDRRYLAGVSVYLVRIFVVFD